MRDIIPVPRKIAAPDFVDYPLFQMYPRLTREGRVKYAPGQKRRCAGRSVASRSSARQRWGE